MDNDEFEESEVSKISDQAGIHVGFPGYIRSKTSFLVAYWSTLTNQNDSGVHWREFQRLYWREKCSSSAPKCARTWFLKPRVLPPPLV